MKEDKKNKRVTTPMQSPPHTPDGGVFTLFNQRKNDIQFVNRVNQEMIRLSGSKILYYKYFQSENYDNVYLEERNKVIAKEPIDVWGSYDPKSLEKPLGEFSIEISDDQLFTFNKSYVESRIGRAPIPGDVLKPVFMDLKYEIIQVQEDGFQLYGVYQYKCTAKVLRDSPDVQDEFINEPPDTNGYKGTLH